MRSRQRAVPYVSSKEGMSEQTHAAEPLDFIGDLGRGSPAKDDPSWQGVVGEGLHGGSSLTVIEVDVRRDAFAPGRPVGVHSPVQQRRAGTRKGRLGENRALVVLQVACVLCCTSRRSFISSRKMCSGSAVFFLPTRTVNWLQDETVWPTLYRRSTRLRPRMRPRCARSSEQPALLGSPPPRLMTCLGGQSGPDGA